MKFINKSQFQFVMWLWGTTRFTKKTGHKIVARHTARYLSQYSLGVTCICSLGKRQVWPKIRKDFIQRCFGATPCSLEATLRKMAGTAHYLVFDIFLYFTISCILQNILFYNILYFTISCIWHYLLLLEPFFYTVLGRIVCDECASVNLRKDE